MRLLRPFLGSDSWHWSSDAFPPLWFCVRALALDGLRVSPFDRHPDGDGGLRKLGLDAKMWREWVVAVIRARETAGEFARALDTPEAEGPLRDRARAAAEVMRAPGSFCPGPDELQARLNEIFADNAPAGEEWKWRMSEVPRLHGGGRQQRALWDALLPFHERLATLTVYFVDYVGPVVMPLPPTTCLIAPEDHPEGLRRQIVEAATSLTG